MPTAGIQDIIGDSQNDGSSVMTNASYKDLLAQRAALEAQIEAARKQELSDVVAKVRGLVQEYGLTADDVFSSRRASTGRGPAAPKYRDPDSGKTWTGRGKPPDWIKGKDRSQFEIA